MPRRVVACAEGTVLVEWRRHRGSVLIAETPEHAQALGDFIPEPLGPLLAPARGWEPTDPERILDGRDLAAWPMPKGWAAPPRARDFPGRTRVTPEPLRQRAVVGDLRAALAELPRRGMVGGWRRVEKGRAA